MTKVVYNACYGGFSLSDAGMARYASIKGLTLYIEKVAGKYAALGFSTYWIAPPDQRGGILEDDDFHRASMEDRQASNKRYDELTLSNRDFVRHDPALVQVVEELGETAGGDCSKLAIAEVSGPYRIDEYDGNERVMTADDYEWITP